jgi:hypothetical protein
MAPNWREAFLVASTGLGLALLAGFLTGLVVGGGLGRVAMFILRLTSDESLRGLKTDDDFTIGRFSADTFFLLGFCGLLGMVAAVVYVAVRGAFPGRWRPVMATALAASVGGTFVLEPDGLDFNLLEPLPLAVAMFIAIPAVYGLAMSLVLEWLLRSPWWRHSRRAWPVLGLAFVPALAGPQAIITLALVGIGTAIQLEPALRRISRTALVAWAMRLATAAAIVVATAQVTRDALEIL